MTQPVLEMRGISKNFAMTKALDGVSVALQPGEIHALVGENGAGKSTLIKIMTGVHQPSSRRDTRQWRGAQPSTVPARGAALGIAAIYQEPMVFPDLDVAENIFISHRDRGRVMNWKKTYEDARTLLARLGVKIDVERPASGLTLAEQQAVEIARALSLDVRVLIMDEPTASLSAHEARQLLGIAQTLQSQGVAVVYIIAPAGRSVRDRRPRHGAARRQVYFHAGDRRCHAREHDLRNGRPRCRRVLCAGAGQRNGRMSCFRSAGLAAMACFQMSAFDVRAGEVLCFAGLVGARRTDVALALFGVAPADAGSDPHRRQGTDDQIAAGSHAGRHRLCVGRPAQARPRHDHADLCQCDAGDAQTLPRQVRLHPPRARNWRWPKATASG